MSDKDEMKAVWKEAIKEYVDEKAAQFGKWTLKWLGSLLFAYLLYWMVSHGLIKG
jgi:hypothetical protein